MSDWFGIEVVILLHFKMPKNVRVYYTCTTIHSKTYFHALYIASENETMHLYFISLNSNSLYIYTCRYSLKNHRSLRTYK